MLSVGDSDGLAEGGYLPESDASCRKAKPMGTGSCRYGRGRQRRQKRWPLSDLRCGESATHTPNGRSTKVPPSRVGARTLEKADSGPACQSMDPIRLSVHSMEHSVTIGTDASQGLDIFRKSGRIVLAGMMYLLRRLEHRSGQSGTEDAIRSVDAGRHNEKPSPYSEEGHRMRTHPIRTWEDACTGHVL